VTQPLEPYTILENCLTRLNQGEDLETVLADFPQQAAELRPLLIAALKASRSGVPLRVPASAQIDSRTRFIVEAQHRQTKPVGFLPRFKLAGALAAIAIIVFVGIFGTGLASAETVPGETLYPVKRVVEQAQLVLTTDQSTRLDLEEEFDRRRIAEAEELEQEGRIEPVTVAGPLEELEDQSWSVGGVKLKLTSDQEAVARTLLGSYIEVKGKIRGEEGIEVENLELRLFTFTGTIEEISGKEWKVSGVKVLVMDSTQIKGTPRVGKRVELTTLHYDEDSFLALTVRVSGSGSNGNGSKEENKGSDDPVITESVDDSPENTLEATRTPEPEETDSSKDDESNKTPDSNDDHQRTETPKPDDDHEPTKTPD
jgi:hypothetical protein